MARNDTNVILSPSYIDATINSTLAISHDMAGTETNGVHIAFIAITAVQDHSPQHGKK